MENHLFTDPIASKRLDQITRADVIDFRSRLIETKGDSTANKVITILKTIFKEGFFREEIEKDPTIGIGRVNYQKTEVGIFTIDELLSLFPRNSLKPWTDIHDYTCFLIAASTGMRRGEILALRWQNVDLGNSVIRILEAWKDKDEIGLPKWNKKRIVPLSNRTTEKLKKLKEQSRQTTFDRLVFW